MVEDNCPAFPDTDDLVPIPNHLIHTAEALASRISELEDVLLGMAELHRLGEEAELALLTLRHVRSVRLVHLSWEMLDVLAEGEGVDIFELFEEIDAQEEMFLFLTGLFGDPVDDECDCGCGEGVDDVPAVRSIR